MSFFDEVDDEPPPPRRAPRAEPRRARPRSGGGRPPSDQQAIQRRRTILVVGVVIVVILMALGIHSCQVSARNSSLKDYNTNVYNLMQSSDHTGATVFRDMSSASATAAGSAGGTAVQTQIDNALGQAKGQLSTAEGWSVPGEMDSAQQHVVLSLKMRRDGIKVISSEIQSALSKSGARDAITQIASADARFYASDVVYKAYAVPAIASALHAAGIPVGPNPGQQQIYGGQFVSDLGWLQADFVAGKLGTSVSTGSSGGKACTGLCGHSLDGVTVNGTALSPTGTNTVSASPAPTFTLNLTNGGNQNETNVGCKVTVSGSSASGTSTIPETTAGQPATCNVTLNSSPTPGTYTVTATVEPVPGEKNTANNTNTYAVTFK